MKKIKFTGQRDDPFSHNGRWDSVGLDCEFCCHIISLDKWPNKEKKYQCGLYNILLSIQIQDNGYKQGEWFCSEFKDNGRTNPQSLKEFEQEKFESKKLYCVGWPGDPLMTINFEEI